MAGIQPAIFFETIGTAICIYLLTTIFGVVFKNKNNCGRSSFSGITTGIVFCCISYSATTHTG